MTKPDLINTAPKRIYLDIGDQFALERVASGDLRWDLLDGVTWSEDNATSHGIPYVRSDLVPTPAASGAAPAEDGYTKAFYEIASVLGIGARADTPENVFRNVMLPRIKLMAEVFGDKYCADCRKTKGADPVVQAASPDLADEFETWVKRAYRDAYEATFTVYNMEVAWHAGRAAALASPQVAPAPEAEICPHCDGSGDQVYMSNAGPDAYEEIGPCEHCSGAGTLAAAYTGVKALLERSRTSLREASAVIWHARDEPAAHQLRNIADYVIDPKMSPVWIRDRLNALADMALAAPVQVAPTSVPDGFALVPLVPTREMWEAVNKLDERCAAGNHDGKGCSIEQAWECLIENAPAAPGAKDQP